MWIFISKCILKFRSDSCLQSSHHRLGQKQQFYLSFIQTHKSSTKLMQCYCSAAAKAPFNWSTGGNLRCAGALQCSSDSRITHTRLQKRTANRTRSSAFFPESTRKCWSIPDNREAHTVLLINGITKCSLMQTYALASFASCPFYRCSDACILFSS